MCVVCADAVDDDAWVCARCGEAVCDYCLGYGGSQATDIVLCGGCVGQCRSCDRSWSKEEDGDECCESWFATHGVPSGGEDDEMLTCPSCYDSLY